MQLVLDGEVGASGIWAQYKSQAEEYICSCAQKSNQNTDKTAGGLLWFLPWNNNQYVATATFVMSVYSNYLSSKGASLQCSAGNVTPDDLTSLVRSQVIHQIKVIIMLKNNYFIKFILFSHSTFIFNFFLKSTFFSILFLFSLHQSNKKQNIIVLFIFLFSFRSKHTDFYLFLCIPTSLRIYDDIFDFSFLFSIG